eukprot:TRINITY_DN10817_c0_g1_i1.p3 TRINITY_DN10817_c0_g1~~TRINITY_DN10817_c0_g1_i1.p3  ORF type:complete len:114 (+),score=31.87 TRINITY_DN10817_c0_g1_i1:361-702(+)
MPPPATSYTHDPYKVDLQQPVQTVLPVHATHPQPHEPSLLAALGDLSGIDSYVDGYLESMMQADCCKVKESDMDYASYLDNLPDDILLLGPDVFDPIYQEKTRAQRDEHQLAI